MINSLSKNTLTKLAGLLNQSTGSSNGLGQFRSQPHEEILFRNKSGNITDSTIPPYGIVQVIGVEIVNDTLEFIEVGKPDGTAGEFLFNGPDEVVNGAIGAVQTQTLVRAAYDPTNVPSVGETWGPESGSWLASPNGDPALVIFGQASNAIDRELVIGSAALGGGLEIKLGKADADITAGSSGTVSIWSDDGISDTGDDVEGFLDWMHGGEDISAGQELLVVRMGFLWRIIGAECEDETIVTVSNRPADRTSIDWSTATTDEKLEWIATALVSIGVAGET